MADKEFKARIRHKRDTSANWTARNPVILNGEIILVDTDSGELRLKIGDGIKTYTQLPFSDEILRNLITNMGNIVVDSELNNLSTNPVQNKVVAAPIEALNELVGDSSVSVQINNAVNNCITNVDVSGQTLTFTKGDGSTDTIVTQDHDTTYVAFQGATPESDGVFGLVPAPAAGNQSKYLRADGTWSMPNDTQYGLATEELGGLMSAEDKIKVNGAASSTDLNALSDTVTQVINTLYDILDQSVKTTSSPTFNVVTANKVIGAVYE